MPDHAQHLVDAIEAMVADASTHSGELASDEAVATLAIPHFRKINAAAMTLAKSSV